MLASDPGAVAGPSVLIVGDPPLGRGLLKLVLSRLGYDVLWLATGREALSAAQRRPLDAILIALALPDVSGIATARRLRDGPSLWASVPLILFGDSWDRDKLADDCREARVDAFLPKPISIARLVAVLRQLTRADATAPPRIPEMPRAPIDVAQLDAFTDGDEALERELVTLYIKTARRYLEEMRTAAKAGASWEGSAHALKGASANIGAGDVAALAAAAERTPPSHDMIGALAAALGEVEAFFAARRLETVLGG
jgi:CheY-like chemotaxis protein/HPt (histidine-containing phosphotransfer) domain-containing protein